MVYRMQIAAGKNGSGWGGLRLGSWRWVASRCVAPVRLSGPEEPKADHGAAATGTDVEGSSGELEVSFAVAGRWRDSRRRRRIQQSATEADLGAAAAVGEQAIVADPMEPVRQGVEEEAADELGGVQGHELGLAVMAIVLPFERHLAVLHADEAAVGDGDAVGVAPEVGEDLFGSPERRLGIGDPVDLAHGLGELGEGRGIGEAAEIAKEGECACLKGGLEALEEEPSVEAGEHAYGQKKAWPAGDPSRAVQ